MTTFAVLASGPSMSADLAEKLRPLRRIAVNDTYLLAPDAEALVANDAAWWRAHPEAMKFAGERYCGASVAGTRRVPECPTALITTSTNSGLVGLHVAIHRGARRVFLFGVDLHDRNGLHFFGAHAKSPNPTPARFSIFLGQFRAYAKRLRKGVEVFNATPGSALDAFPFVGLEEALAEIDGKLAA